MLKIYLIIAILSILGGIGVYVNSLTSKISALSSANAELTLVAETNMATIKQMTEDAENLNKQINTLTVNLQKAESYKDDLQKKLQQHNLAKLSLEKPKVIEKRINDATAKVFRDFEQLTSN